MRIGDEVRTGISLPGIPVGTLGRVAEIGGLFVVVQFEDGRHGYYSPPQLQAMSDHGTEPGSDGLVELGFDDASLPRGAHLCLLPADAEETFESIASFLLAGLRAGEDCACAMPLSWARPVRSALLRAAGLANGVLRVGRLQIIDHRDVYTPDCDTPAVRQLTRTRELVTRLVGQAKMGARIVGYPGDDVVQTPWWWEYEERVTPVLTETGATALCVYDPADGDGAIWRRAESVHPYVARAGRLSAGGRSPGPISGLT